MPVEFALRPRIRLTEGFAPARRRRGLPKFALPILAYWLTAAAITYEVIHLHDRTRPPSEEAEAASQPGPRVDEQPEPAWRGATPPIPAPTATELSEVPSATLPSTATASAATVIPDSPRAEPAPAARRRTTPEAVAALPEVAQGDPTARRPAPSDPANDAASAAPLDLRAEARGGGALPSCAAAAEAANEELDLAHRAVTPDLPRESIAAVLDDGAWLGDCAIPDATSVEVCVAISSGNVLGATVISSPPSSALNACIKGRAAWLLFPYSSRLDLARTRFNTR